MDKPRFPMGTNSVCDLEMRREAIEDLATTVCPNLSALLVEVKLADATEVALRDWIAAISSRDPSAIADPETLLQIFGKLSSLYLSAHAFAGVCNRSREPAELVDLDLAVMTRTDPEIVRRAQLRIAGILEGMGDGAIMASLSRVHSAERDRLCQISRAIARTMV